MFSPTSPYAFNCALDVSIAPHHKKKVHLGLPKLNGLNLVAKMFT